MFGYGVTYYPEESFAGAPIPGYIGTYDPYGTIDPYAGSVPYGPMEYVDPYAGDPYAGDPYVGDPYVDYGDQGQGGDSPVPPPYVDYGPQAAPTAPDTYVPQAPLMPQDRPEYGPEAPNDPYADPHAGATFPAPDSPAPHRGEHAPHANEQDKADGQQAPHADFRRGVEAWQARDYPRARDHFSRVTGAEPGNGEAWLALMHTYFAEGQFESAAACLRQAANLNAFPRGYRFEPARLYENAESFATLRTALHSHVANNANDLDALLLKSYFHVALGETVQARAGIRRVLSARPGDEAAGHLKTAMLPAPPPPTDEQAPSSGK